MLSAGTGVKIIICIFLVIILIQFGRQKKRVCTDDTAEIHNRISPRNQLDSDEEFNRRINQYCKFVELIQEEDLLSCLVVRVTEQEMNFVLLMNLYKYRFLFMNDKGMEYLTKKEKNYMVRFTLYEGAESCCPKEVCDYEQIRQQFLDNPNGITRFEFYLDGQFNPEEEMEKIKQSIDSIHKRLVVKKKRFLNKEVLIISRKGKQNEV